MIIDDSENLRKEVDLDFVQLHIDRLLTLHVQKPLL